MTAMARQEPIAPSAESGRPAGQRAAGPRGSGDWLGLGEASRILGISHGTLRRWADAGRVAVFITPGGHRRFSRRTILAILPTRRAHRPTLARLGASPERIVRAYRPGRPAGGGLPAGPPWMEALGEEERTAFRERGREIVSTLLGHLDATEPDAADDRLQHACRLAADHGRRVARLGASMAEAVETFLRFRAPFIGELAGIARRRGLDTREATDLLVEAEAAMDRLLIATMTGHSLESGAAGRRRRPHRSVDEDRRA